MARESDDTSGGDVSSPEPGAEPVRSRSDALVNYGARISRDTAIYGTAKVVPLPFSLITVAVITRYLDPSEYGRLAIAFVFASLLTHIYNLGSLQGTFMWVFGSSGDDDDGGGEEDVRARGARAGAKRQALSTGLVLTTFVAAVGSAVLAVAAAPTSELLFGSDEETAIVHWASASAALGAIWRLVINIFRFELRPRRFVVMTAARPTLVLAWTVPLVAAGHGIEGALAGTAIGTGLGIAVCLLIGRRSYARAIDLGAVKPILRTGSRYIGVIAGLWVVHNADVFMLSRYASEDDVGLYRLASRVAVGASYFVSAFTMAWAPLERTSLFQGTYKLVGRWDVRSRLVTYYFVCAFTLVLAMAVLADVLVKIAAPSYADAAKLIAPLGAGFVAYGGYVVLFRAGRIKHRLAVYSTLSVAAGGAFVGYATLLIPPYGAYGAAVSVIVTMATAAAVVVLLIRRSADPVPFEWRKLLTLFVLGGVAYAGLRQSPQMPYGLQPVAEAAIFVAFLALLVVLRVVPLAHLRILWRIARSVTPGRQHARSLVERVAELPDEQRDAVEAVARRRLGSSAAAEALDVDVDELHVRLVAGLRALVGLGAPRPDDAEVGAYLLTDEPPAERIPMVVRLTARGVNQLDLHELETALAQLRKARPNLWPPAQPEPPVSLPR